MLCCILVQNGYIALGTTKQSFSKTKTRESDSNNLRESNIHGSKTNKNHAIFNNKRFKQFHMEQ